MSVFLLIVIFIIFVTLSLGVEVVSKRLAARRSSSPVEGSPAGEVDRLREHVALLADQVDRLTEEQRFITRLLEGEAPSGTTPSD